MNVIKLVLVLILIPVIAVLVIAFWMYSALNSPHQHDKSSEYIQIEKGSTPNQIIGKLVSEGILANNIPVLIYLRTIGDARSLQAGDYRFESPITALQVLTELKSGSDKLTKLTIPEGFTRFDIAKRIAEQFPQDPPMDEKAILYLMNDTSLIRDFDPSAKNLEGYMYPSTYEFSPNTPANLIITRMVEQFRKAWKPVWNVRAQELGRTPAEIVTIASLIETESKFEDERPLVASVIYNRLRMGIPLGIDQTAVYIAKMLDRWDGTINKSDLEVNSPYNTRIVSGLPPGPISSVSASSLNAALNPVQSDYLFYVLNVGKNDGSHSFYVAASDFERGKAAYQKWLEAQRAEKRAESNK